MKKQDYVLQVTAAIKENPRAVLSGHGISPTVLQNIVERDDVLAKLASFGYSLKTAKKMEKGLKKTATFRIAGYKSFGEFNAKARLDVEEFINGLPEADVPSFKNGDSIVTLLILPQSSTPSEGTTEANITSGKSVALNFEKAVKKEYKLAGGFYLCVFIGQSAVRPQEEKIAERKEKVNEAKQNKRTPAVLARELKSKANRKLDILKRKRANLQQIAYRTSKQMQQYGSITSEFGTRLDKASKFDASLRSGVQNTNAVLASLSPDKKALVDSARNFAKKGNMKVAGSLLSQAGLRNNAIIADYVKNGAGDSRMLQKGVLGAKEAGLRSELGSLKRMNNKLLDALKTADSSKKASIRSQISRNNGKIRDLDARLGVYKDLSVKGNNKRAKLLTQVNADIANNIATGSTISEALNAAIAALPVTPQQKQAVRQQVMQQVAEGMPLQYAAQSAVQKQVFAQQLPVQGFGSNQFADQFAGGDAFGGGDDAASLLADIEEEMMNELNGVI